MSAKRKPKPGGKRFSTPGFYVEGRHFPVKHIDFACAFAGKLSREYDRAVDVLTCIAPGGAMQYFRYVPHESAEALAATPTRDGYVIICNGRRMINA